MSQVDELTLTNVRCFEGAQTARPSRITVLVGENSTGKSSLMACYQAFVQLATFDELKDGSYFDKSPFHLGGFDTIARTGAETFSLEGSTRDHTFARLHATYGRGPDGYPEERRMRIEFERPSGAADWFDIYRPTASASAWTLKGRNFIFELDRAEVSLLEISAWLSKYVRTGHLPYGGDPVIFRKRTDATAERQAEFAKLLTFLNSELLMPGKPAVGVEALNPSPPERRRVYGSPPWGECDDGLSQFLAQMGKQLDLFRGAWQRTLADGNFDIQVEMPDGIRNIVDVGYGVHSVLWLLQQMYGTSSGTVFLLQQPEIHLHPVAQARLSQLMAESPYRFMVETHSEHFLTRLRIRAMRGELDPREVSIIYLAPNHDRTKSTMHNMSIDEMGNLRDAPKGYREFFFNETQALLGLD